MESSSAGTSTLITPSSFKIVLLGEGAVGKSSILLRYTANKFIENHESTIQAAFAAKKINVGGNEIELSIWDTAGLLDRFCLLYLQIPGQEKFHSLGPIYYRGSNGALLVYDITDPHSFQRVCFSLQTLFLCRCLGKKLGRRVKENARRYLLFIHRWK